VMVAVLVVVESGIWWLCCQLLPYRKSRQLVAEHEAEGRTAL